MRRLWKWIADRNISYEKKLKVFLLLNTILFGMLGFVVWAIVSKFTLDTWYFALCFFGYAAFFIGFIGGYIFIVRSL